MSKCCSFCRYNVSHVAIGLGDKVLAHQALKVAVSLNSNHAEAHNNLGLLESQQSNADAAVHHYGQAQDLAPAMYEALYNAALMAYRSGDIESAHKKVNAALDSYPEHAQSRELLRAITNELRQV
jgi:tetratricopeptide repeat protein 8